MKRNGRQGQGPEQKDPPNSLSFHSFAVAEVEQEHSYREGFAFGKSLIVLPPLEQIPPEKESWQSFYPTWVGAYLIWGAKEKEANHR